MTLESALQSLKRGEFVLAHSTVSTYVRGSSRFPLTAALAAGDAGDVLKDAPAGLGFPFEGVLRRAGEGDGRDGRRRSDKTTIPSPTITTFYIRSLCADNRSGREINSVQFLDKPDSPHRQVQGTKQVRESIYYQKFTLLAGLTRIADHSIF